PLLLAGCGAPRALVPAERCAAADTVRVPLTQLGAGCYKGFAGGLYPDGSNEIPPAHLAAGLAAARAIRPLGPDGAPSATGKYVLLSIGMSNTTQEFCSAGGLPGSCEATSFFAQAAADPAVNHTQLVVVNGAYGGRAASSWTSPTMPDYDRVRDSWLTPLGLSERQVQVVWIKQANPGPRVALPATNADAYLLEASIAQALRAVRVRYPNVRQVFLSSRIYGGYATSSLNPEPYAYEGGFAMKWVVQAQIDQAAGAAPSVIAGDLRYDAGVAPWVAWGPYLWADGATPRADGLTWERSDFNPSDYTHPASGARQKVGKLLLEFFKSSPATQCWFLAGRSC
ncbi:MAG TPA: hypothetical protein VGD77_12940, partial [Gemmatimonadaceae bacterium]